jgi:DnaJ-class molecular chaperone
MVCTKCRGDRCPRCDGSGKQHVMLGPEPKMKLNNMLELIGGILEEIKDVPDNDNCLNCKGEGRVNVDHKSCQDENARRGFPNCDCQHREPGSQSAFLQPSRSG